MKVTFAVLVLLAIAAVIWFQSGGIDEPAVWRDLTQRIPPQPLTSAEAEITNDGVFAKLTPEHDEVGHIQLASGDIWRFAFRSHHVLNGPDSFSVFSGPLGTFRVRGDYFCCEVQFATDSIPTDSAELLAFLRRVHPSVESVP